MEKKFSWPKFLIALIFVGGLFYVLWMRRPAVFEVEIIQGHTMGTTYRVSYFPPMDGPPLREELAQEVEKILELVNSQMSTYRPDSIISKFNRSPVGEWIPIPNEFAQVLDYSLWVADKSNGAFDPTIGPLVNLWGFGPPETRRVPGEEQILQGRAAVGYDRVIEWDSKRQELRRLHNGAYLDLSATAKGYAVDLISDYFYSAGLKNHLVEIGGDLRARGERPDGMWRVGLEIPNPEGGIGQRIIEVKDLAPVGSGSYRNYFEQDGVRYSHTIDPETGRPIQHDLIAVTIVAESALYADGLATAFMSMGFEQAMELAKELSVAAFMVRETGQEFSDQVKRDVVIETTPAFTQLFGF